MALDMIDYKKMREEQQKARKKGRYMGIGFATVVDPSVTNIAYVTLALTPEQRAKAHPKSGSGVGHPSGRCDGQRRGGYP
jgi:2-furoyl-CoA dehydrogenase large subunit